MDKFGVFEERFNYNSQFDELTVRFDGSCLPVNPNGNLGWGWVILDQDDIVAEGWGYQLKDETNRTSNNVAEWAGVYYGMKFLLDNNILYQKLTTIGDSKMVINQLLGHFRISVDRIYSPIALRFVDELRPHFKGAMYKWERRDNNDYCDALSTKYVDYLGLDQSKEFDPEARRISSAKFLEAY